MTGTVSSPEGLLLVDLLGDELDDLLDDCRSARPVRASIVKSDFDTIILLTASVYFRLLLCW